MNKSRLMNTSLKDNPVKVGDLILRSGTETGIVVRVVQDITWGADQDRYYAIYRKPDSTEEHSAWLCQIEVLSK